MKLAEALLLRGDLQRALASLRERIGRNTLVQEDERPSEDTKALLSRAEAIIRELQGLTFAINEANLSARTTKGRPLTLFAGRAGRHPPAARRPEGGCILGNPAA